MALEMVPVPPMNSAFMDVILLYWGASVITELEDFTRRTQSFTESTEGEKRKRRGRIYHTPSKRARQGVDK